VRSLVGRSGMSRALILGILFAGVVMNSSWAQNKNGPDARPPYPGGSEITFQWDYSCPTGRDCSFTCGTGGASHVTLLSISLGTMPVGTDQKNPAVLYDFTTRELRRGNGFSVSTGINTLSCQVNGLTVEYSGPPREGGRRLDATGSITQNNR
jgi:hypothetical protein